jgi:hypothetical protein
MTTGSPPVSKTAYGKDLTFQVAPDPHSSTFPKACDPRLANTPHRSGMLIALADGSVRTITSSVSQTVYWGAVTPRGGEVLGNDW